MMFLNVHKKNGQSVLEYVALVTFVIVAIIVIQNYVVRGFSGRWRDIGDSFGQGRQYDPNRTRECEFDYQFTNRWYTRECFEAKHGDCLSIDVTCGWPTTCGQAWITNCQNVISACANEEILCNADRCDRDIDCGDGRRCLNFQCVAGDT